MRTIAACTLALVIGWCGSHPAAAQTPVRIGLSAPITGPDATFGAGLRLGAEQAVADLNRAGTRRFVLTVADDGGDPRQATGVATRFANEGIALVVGPYESSAVSAAAPSYERAGTVLITPGATYSPLTGRGLWNVFRLGPSDALQARTAADYLAKAYAKRPIGIVSDRTTFGRGLTDAVAARLRELGQPEAVFLGLERGTRDFAGVVARLATAKVAAVYFGGTATEAVGLLKAMRDARLGATLVGSDALLSMSFAALGAVGEGTVMTLAPDAPRLPDPRGGKPVAHGPETDGVAGIAYAAVQVLAKAAERGQAVDPRTGRIDGRKVAQALRGERFKTVLGTVGFDGQGDETGEAVVLRVWRRTPDGRLDYANQEPPA